MGHKISAIMFYVGHKISALTMFLQVRWFFKREVDKDWTSFMGYDSLRVELRYRHIWQTKWSEADRRTNIMNLDHRGPPPSSRSGMGPPGGHRGRRARSLNRVHYGNGLEDEDYMDDPERGGYKEDFAPPPNMGGGSGPSSMPPGYFASSPSAARQGFANRGRLRNHRLV